ncbi:MAG: helix-hairpin-helix domain-containing protein [Chloroflexota bacterium]
MDGALLAGMIIGIFLGVLLYWIMAQFLGNFGPTPAEADLMSKLEAAEKEVGSLKEQLAEAQSQAGGAQQVYVQADRLEKLNGVGKVYAQKLNDAGIFTFGQVAQETADRLREIISPESWQTIEPDAWIAEAAQMAAAGK